MDLHSWLAGKRVMTANLRHGSPSEVGVFTHIAPGNRNSKLVFGNWLAYYENVETWDRDTSTFVRSGEIEVYIPDQYENEMYFTIGSPMILLGAP